MFSLRHWFEYKLFVQDMCTRSDCFAWHTSVWPRMITAHCSHIWRHTLFSSLFIVYYFNRSWSHQLWILCVSQQFVTKCFTLEGWGEAFVGHLLCLFSRTKGFPFYHVSWPQQKNLDCTVTLFAGECGFYNDTLVGIRIWILSSCIYIYCPESFGYDCLGSFV